MNEENNDRSAKRAKVNDDPQPPANLEEMYEMFKGLKDDHEELKGDHEELKGDHEELKGDHTKLEGRLSSLISTLAPTTVYAKFEAAVYTFVEAELLAETMNATKWNKEPDKKDALQHGLVGQCRPKQQMFLLTEF